MTQEADQQRAITPGEPPADTPARERRTTMSTLTSLGKGRKQWLPPFCLSVSFTVAIQTLGLSEFLPVPLALLAAAAWGIGIGLIAIRIGNKVTLSAWLEDALVVVGAVAMAFFAFGGLVGILLLSSALKSSSLSGETLVLMFLPSIPLAIMANAPVELFVFPVLLILGWREGTRRILIVAAAALYFVHRVWTYLVFASDRLDFAETEKSTTSLTTADRQQSYTDLHLDDPRWVLNLAIFAVLLLAAHFSRVRELNAAAVSAGSQGPDSRSSMTK
jgi:MFS family permease